jgi:transcriptional regulator with XRE-family HTH domain
VAQNAEKQFLFSVGENIRKYRLKNNMSQSQLAYEVSVTLRQIQRMEAGETNASIISYYKIAQVLEIDLNTLFKIKA